MLQCSSCDTAASRELSAFWRAACYFCAGEHTAVSQMHADGAGDLVGSVLLQCAAETCEISCVSILSRLFSQNKKKRQPILNSHLQVPVCLRWEGMAFVALCKKTQETNILSP